jgi:outer membrane protein insertion porin family
VQRSLREVVALGYFNGPPKVNTEQANEAGDINLLIGVEEKQTGNFRFGAGFSQLNSLSGFFGIQENNLLGRGKGVSLDWEFGKYRQSFNFQYTEPYFRNTRNTVSLSLYNWIQDRVRQQYYNDRRKGFSVALGRPFPWLDYTRLYTSYRLEEVELSNFSSLYPEIGALRGVDWPQIKSAVLVSLTRNSTDNPSHPTKGSVNSLSAEFCGGVLQGNVNYMRYIAETSWFRTLFWKFTFHMNMELGAIDGFTSPDQVQDFEKFRLGGNRRYALRGYDFYEVVPEGNDAYVGGRFMASFTHEILFPFTDAVYGLFFFDAGNTWNSFGSADLFNLRRGLGLGVRLEMPGLGNLGFDYGYGYDKVGGPAWEPHFTFGTMF